MSSNPFELLYLERREHMHTREKLKRLSTTASAMRAGFGFCRAIRHFFPASCGRSGKSAKY